ncbi:MAG: putative sugar nucleotidyl transferase [Pirellulaceae bacterium]
MQTITFEDEHVHNLVPITLARPAYAILCGSFRLVDWIEQLDKAPQAVVRDYLVEIQEADYPCFRKREIEAPRKKTMWINARLVPSRDTFETLCTLRDRGQVGIVHCGSAVAVAILPETAPPPPRHAAGRFPPRVFRTARAGRTPTTRCRTAPDRLSPPAHPIQPGHAYREPHSSTPDGRIRGGSGRRVCGGKRSTQ